MANEENTPMEENTVTTPSAEASAAAADKETSGGDARERTDSEEGKENREAEASDSSSDENVSEDGGDEKNNRRRNSRNNNSRGRNQTNRRKNSNNNSRSGKSGNRRRRSEFPDDESLDAEAARCATPSINLSELQNMEMSRLTEMGHDFDIPGVGSLSKHDLIFEIIKKNIGGNGLLYGGGTVEILQDGFAFLRIPSYSYLPCPEDIYMSPSQVRRFGLRTGDTVFGVIRQPREKERFFAMLKVDSINSEPPDMKSRRIPFESLTASFPDERLLMERGSKELSMRVMDLITPVGRGQRGMIVAPPQSGKTVLLQKIADSVTENNDDITLIVLLIDERPEEVTEMRRSVSGEVVSSTFDEPPERHIQVAEMVIEKAKRLVEHGQNVVILLDSLTRLARAYNTLEPNSGRILSGGIDANALHKAKRFFGAARNVEGGGSLTILATALIETGSRMDEVIFEEFKGTGNMELFLDRRLAERRIYPAINVEQSGTLREELLLHPDELERVWSLRTVLAGEPAPEAMEMLLEKVKKTGSNIEYLMSLKV